MAEGSSRSRGAWLAAGLLLATAAGGGLWVASTSDAPARVVLEPARRFQRMEGFGTCLISWDYYPKKTYTDEFVAQYRRRLGLNMLRVDLGAFSHPEVAAPEDVKASKVKVTEAGEVFVRFAKRLRAVDPEARIIGTVWTPPAWMKLNRALTNGSKNQQNEGFSTDTVETSDNRVAPDHIAHFVRWLVAVVRWHQAQGIDLYAVSLANEPRFSQWYSSCVWGAETYAKTLVRLRAALDEAGFDDVLLFGPEDMTGHMEPGATRSMLQAIVDTPGALDALDRFATHGYLDGVQGDTRRASSVALNRMVEPLNKPYWMTEGGTLGHVWPEPITVGVASAMHNAIVLGNAAAFLPWQVSEAKPTTNALMVGAQLTKKSFAAMQYTRTIPVGAYRIGAEADDDGLLVSAFADDTRVVVVLTNPTEAPRPVRIQGLAEGAPVEVRRTSATEDFARIPVGPVSRAGLELELPALSISTVTATQGPSMISYASGS